MSNPRAACFAALREQENIIESIPPLLTIGAVEDIKKSLVALAQTQRRAVEWIDAIELN